MRAMCVLMLAVSVGAAADKPDADELRRQLREAESKVRELKVKLAAADNPRTLPNGRTLAYHTDDRGRPTRVRVGAFDSHVDVRSVGAGTDTVVTLIIQVFRWDKQPIPAADRRPIEGVKIVTDTGEELKLSPAPYPPEEGSPRLYVRVPAGVRYIDVDIPDTMAGGKGDVFRWRVLSEKWQSKRKR
jgi:hypothetical protein